MPDQATVPQVPLLVLYAHLQGKSASAQSAENKVVWPSIETREKGEGRGTGRAIRIEGSGWQKEKNSSVTGVKADYQ
jgi:hypothetical protein